MSESKGFEVVPNPQREAQEWFELFRAGRLEEAAAQAAARGRRNREATRRAVEAFLQAREDARR